MTQKSTSQPLSSSMSTMSGQAAATTTIEKIHVANPVVEMDGDEMTRIIWQEIKNKVRQLYYDRCPIVSLFVAKFCL